MFRLSIHPIGRIPPLTPEARGKEWQTRALPPDNISPMARGTGLYKSAVCCRQRLDRQCFRVPTTMTINCADS